MNPVGEEGKRKSGDSITIISVAVFILLATGIIIFLYNQNQALKEKLSTYQNAQITPTPQVTPQASVSPSASASASPKSIKTPTSTSSAILK